MSHGGDVQWSDAEEHLRCDVRSESSGAHISIVFRRPLPLGGKDRLVLEGRGEESTELALHVSRVALLGADRRTAAVYEEDLIFPPEWNRRTLLLDDFDRPPPKTVRGVVLSLWEPGEIGRRYTLRLRRCEFLSPRQVADELKPSSAKVRPALEPRASVVEAKDRRWKNLGPGIDYPNAFYRSTDGGTTWTNLEQSAFLESPGSRDGDQGARVYLTSLAADPSRPGTIYAALQEEGYDVSNGRGVLVSRDRGDTWEPFVLDGLTCYRVGTLIVDPVNPSRLYAGTGGNGLFRFGPPPQ